MRINIIILLVFIFYQCSNKQPKETNNSHSDLELIDTAWVLSQIKELPKRLNGKDAIEILKRTKDFQLDFEGNKAGFKVVIDSFANGSNEFYYFRTTYINSDDMNQTLSYYRINSKYGYIEKKKLKSKEWVRIN